MKRLKDIEESSSTFAKGLEAYIEKHNLKYSGLCNFASMSFCEWEMSKKAGYVLFYHLHAANTWEDKVIDFTARQFCLNAPAVLILNKQDYLYWLLGSLSQRGIYFPLKKWEELENKLITTSKNQSIWNAQQKFNLQRYQQLSKLIKNEK